MGQNIQSVERVATILAHIAGHPETPLFELTSELNLSKSTVYGLLTTMVEVQLLFKNPLTSNYSLGALGRSLGRPLNDDQLVTILLPELGNVSKKLDQTIHLGVRRGAVVHYIAKIEASRPKHVSKAVGKDDDLFSTAVGKVLLANMPGDQLHSYINNSIKSRETRQSIDLNRLKRDLRLVASDNIAFDNGEQNPAVRCIAVGIRDHENRVIAAVSVVIPEQEWTVAKKEKITITIQKLVAKMQPIL